MAIKILITGGAGFIGSAVIRHVIQHTPHVVLNVDKLTYAGNLANVAQVAGDPRYQFAEVDICDAQAMSTLLADFQPQAILHLAAESHVDRSIDAPGAFVDTNIMGTYTLLEAARRHWQALSTQGQADFRFHHVSTDEVYGDLGASEGLFTEASAYAPSSPYAASKASSDHLVRAWHRTYGLPVILTHCSNNYGPYQYPEKLIPLMILNSLEGQPLPVYGGGQQVRDWLYVEDHARALVTALTQGRVGASYNIGGHNALQNIEVVREVCELLEELLPGHAQARSAAHPRGFAGLITSVADRPGHDTRYAIDAGKIQRELGWRPMETFATGLRKTVQWVLAHKDWAEQVQAEARVRRGVISGSQTT